jgi:hypothetical protein
MHGNILDSCTVIDCSKERPAATGDPGIALMCTRRLGSAEPRLADRQHVAAEHIGEHQMRHDVERQPGTHHQLVAGDRGHGPALAPGLYRTYSVRLCLVFLTPWANPGRRASSSKSRMSGICCGVHGAGGGGLAKARVARRSSQVGKTRKLVIERRFSKNRPRDPIFSAAWRQSPSVRSQTV